MTQCVKCKEETSNLHYFSGKKGWVTSSCSSGCKVRRSYVDDDLVVDKGDESDYDDDSDSKKLKRALKIAKKEKMQEERSKAEQEAEDYFREEEEEVEEDFSDYYEDEDDDYYEDEESVTEVIKKIMKDFKIPPQARRIIIKNSEAQERRNSYLHPETLRELLTDLTRLKKNIVNQFVSLYETDLENFLEESVPRQKQKTSRPHDRFSPSFRREEEVEEITMVDVQAALEKQATMFREQLFELDKRNIERELSEKTRLLEEERARRHQSDEKLRDEITASYKKQIDDAKTSVWGSDEMRFVADQRAMIMKAITDSQLIDKVFSAKSKQGPQIPVPPDAQITTPPQVNVSQSRQSELNKEWDETTSNRPKKKKTGKVSVLDYLDEE